MTLSLAEAVLAGDTVTVAYTAPGAGAKLRDADHDELPVPNFTAQGAGNLTPAIGSRNAFHNAAVNGNSLTVSLNTSMSATHRPPGSAFTVTATPPGGTARTIDGTGDRVAISGTAVTVTLDRGGRPQRRGDGELRQAVGERTGTSLQYSVGAVYVANFDDEPVTNNTPGAPAPTFESASYSYPGGGITVNFDGPFTGCANDIAWSFKVDGTQSWPLAVRCEGRSVRLILDFLSQTPLVEAARRVTVSYNRHVARLKEESRPFFHPPRGLEPSGTRLRGTDGSEVASFTDKPVTGLKPRLVPPPTVDGETLTLTFDEEMDPGATPGERALRRHRERRAAQPRPRRRHRHRRQDGAADPALGGGPRRHGPGALHQAVQLWGGAAPGGCGAPPTSPWTPSPTRR